MLVTTVSAVSMRYLASPVQEHWKRKTAMASETLEGFVKKLRTMSGIGLVGLSRSASSLGSEVRVTISSSLGAYRDHQLPTFRHLIENVDSSRMT
ncbi:hypothetical protein BDFG_00970 [Blastomyces dermatitidis ATCC 26199]|nr:hypothetical protein BDFG_00970 [Blastomyces dermatitidis ATCC 26199]